MSKKFDGMMTNKQRVRRLVWAAATLLMLVAALPIAAQDDVTTQNAASASDGAWITGPASNPLSHLNGPAFRTSGSPAPYDVPDLLR